MNKRPLASIAAIVVAIVVVGVVSYRAATRMSDDRKDMANVGAAVPTVGQPCDFNAVAQRNSEFATYGLQCYLYGPAGTDRKGIWISPNEALQPLFMNESELERSFDQLINADALLASWSTYADSDGRFSFRLPPTWKVEKDVVNDESKQVNYRVITDPGDSSIQIFLQYGTEDFWSTLAGQQVRAVQERATDDLFTGLDYVRSFTLNSKEAIGVVQLPLINTGETPYSVQAYVFGENGYLTVAYSKYNDPFIDVPSELLIRSLQLK